MPRRTPSDGGHTAFTDHRIARNPDKEEAFSQPASIVAWRPSPESSLQQRNIALALAHIATEHQSAALLASSYQMLNYVQRDFPNDPNVLSQLGLLALISGHQPQQAYDLFDHVAQIQPDSAEAQTNMAAALIRLNRQTEAVAHLEKALALDPLSRSSVNLLVRLYQQQGDNAKASDILTSYRRAMGIKTTQ